MNLYELSGAELMVLANSISLCIAQDLNSEQISIISSFFTILGDNLALLALTQFQNNSTPETDSNCDK